MASLVTFASSIWGVRAFAAWKTGVCETCRWLVSWCAASEVPVTAGKGIEGPGILREGKQYRPHPYIGTMVHRYSWVLKLAEACRDLPLQGIVSQDQCTHLFQKEHAPL